jgi:hypothetical protein
MKQAPPPGRFAFICERTRKLLSDIRGSGCDIKLPYDLVVQAVHGNHFAEPVLKRLTIQILLGDVWVKVVETLDDHT